MHLSSYIQNIIKAFAAASFGQVVNVLSQILLVTFYIESWGAQLYGEWLILSAASSIIAMAGNLGFGTVAANEMTASVAKQDRESALKIFENTWITISCFSIILVLVAMLLLYFLPIVALLNVSLISEEPATIIVFLLLLKIVMRQQNLLLYAGLRCEGNYALGMFLDTISRLIEAVLLGVLLFLYEVQPVYVAATCLGVPVGAWIVLRIILMKISPWIKYGFGHFSINLIRELLPTAMSYLSFPIINAISIQGVTTAIGILLGPTAVVIFSTTRTFMNILKQAVNVVNLSVWAELTTAYASHNYQRARRIFTASNQVVLLMVCVFNIVIFVVGKSLYEYWTKGEVATTDSFFYLFSFVSSINAIWYTNSIVQVATSKANKLAIYNILSAAILMGLILLSQQFLQLNGVLVSMLISEFFMLFLVNKDSLAILKLDALSFYSSFFNIRFYHSSNN